MGPSVERREPLAEILPISVVRSVEYCDGIERLGSASLHSGPWYPEPSSVLWPFEDEKVCRSGVPSRRQYEGGCACYPSCIGAHFLGTLLRLRRGLPTTTTSNHHYLLAQRRRWDAIYANHPGYWRRRTFSLGCQRGRAAPWLHAQQLSDELCNHFGHTGCPADGSVQYPSHGLCQPINVTVLCRDHCPTDFCFDFADGHINSGQRHAAICSYCDE